MRFSLPAPWDVTLDLNVTVLDAGTPPTAQLIPSHSGNTKHWTLQLGLSAGAQGVQGPAVAIDSALSSTSTNAVQNKAVNTAIANCVQKTGDQTMAGALTCNGSMLKGKLVATTSANVAGAIWIA